MSKSIIVALSLALLGLAAARPSASIAAPETTVSVSPEGLLAIGGVGIMYVRDKSVCESLAQRSDRIMDRLVKAIGKIHERGRFRDMTITVAPPADEPWIVIEGVPVMKVTVQDVSATKEAAQALARRYAGRFRSGLRRIYGP